MEYCCHVWAGSPSCYLKMLDKLQKRIFRTVGSSFVASLEPLGHRRKLARISLSCRYYFGRCSPELGQLVPLPYSSGSSTCYSERLHDFSVTIPRCYQDFYVNSYFSHTARLWNSLLIECFLLSHDLNGFKSVQSCTLELTDTFYQYVLSKQIPVCFNLFVPLFLVTICLLVAVQPCME